MVLEPLFMGEEERNHTLESGRRNEHPYFKIKSETKNFLTITDVNRAGSPVEISKLLWAGMLLLVGSIRLVC